MGNFRILAVLSFIAFVVSLILVVSFSFASAAADVPAFSLNDVYASALGKAERIGISEQDVVIADRGKDKALAALLPRLSAFYSSIHYSDAKTAGTMILQPDNLRNYGARVDYTLSLGGKEFFVRNAASLAADRGRLDSEAVKEAYLITVAGAYFDVLRTRKLAEISRAAIERLTKYRNAAATRLRIGEVTKTAVLRAEAELSGAQSELIRTENLHIYTTALLARLAGLPESYELKEPTKEDEERLDTVVPGCSPLSVFCARERAFIDRPEMKAADLLVSASKAQLNAVRSSYFPTVSVEGVYSRLDQRPDSILTNKESIYGGVRFNLPIFEGGLRVAESGEAQAKLRQAELTMSDVRKTIALEVEQAYLDLITLRGMLKSLSDQVSFARDNYHAVSRQFEFGLANSLDVFDANDVLVSAERQYSSAWYNYFVALIKIQRSAGSFIKTIALPTQQR
ncbi:MAG TPA: TolC family protein [Dissulfurispiraceae bacterium]|nr:TolC family protein [Dissulfurispiraceae bacterium]